MQRRTLIILLLAFSAMAVGILALCAGGAYFAFRSVATTANQVSPIIDGLIASFIAEDSDAYEQQTADALKQVTTQAQFDQLGDLVRNHLGPLKSKTTTTCNVRSINGRTYADVSYKAVFAKGNGTITARLQHERGDWRFVSINIQSPKLVGPAPIPTVACTACGVASPAGSKFCSACGKALFE